MKVRKKNTKKQQWILYFTNEEFHRKTLYIHFLCLKIYSECDSSINRRSFETVISFLLDVAFIAFCDESLQIPSADFVVSAVFFLFYQKSLYSSEPVVQDRLMFFLIKQPIAAGSIKARLAPAALSGWTDAQFEPISLKKMRLRALHHAGWTFFFYFYFVGCTPRTVIYHIKKNKSPFSSKFSRKKRSSHQGEKEATCIVSKPLVSCLWGCGESVNPPKLNTKGVCPPDHRETQARYPFSRIFYFCQITPLIIVGAKGTSIRISECLWEYLGY